MSKFKLLIIVLVLTQLMGCSTATPPPIATPSHQPPVVQGPPARVAVVLGAGGARGMAHIGVLKVLQQYRVPVDVIVGTDSGSIVGAMYADNPNTSLLQRRLANAELSDLVDISAFHLLEGPITGDALQNYLLSHMHARYFNQLSIRFTAVATDLLNGQTIALSSGPIAPAVNASAALPPFFRPVKLYGKTLIDGMTTDPVAVDIAKTYQPKVIIAINIAEQLPREMPTNIVGIYDRIYSISDRKMNYYSSTDANIIIRPEMPVVYAPDRAQRLQFVKIGEQATLQAMPMICAVLQKNHIASACSTDKIPSPPPPPKKNLKTKIKKLITPIENQLNKAKQMLPLKTKPN